MYKLLIVDDNATQLESVIQFIDWEKLNVTNIKTARNGIDGIEKFKEFMPDIVITDIAMPRMNGIDMTKKLREMQPNLKIIFMSCYEDFSYIKDAIDNNVISYVLKPIDSLELTNSVIKIIGLINSEKKALEIFKEIFLLQLLYFPNLNTEEIEADIRQFGYDEFKSFLTVKLQMTYEEDFKVPYSDTYRILNEMKNLVKISENTDDIHSDILIENKNKLVIFFMSDVPNSEIFLERCLSVLKKISKFIQSDFNIKINIGVSNVGDSLADIQKMLMQANTAMENIFFDKDNRIHLYGNYNLEDKSLDLGSLKNDLGKMLEDANEISVEKFLAKYYHKTGTYSINYIKSLCFSIITTLQLLLLERRQDIKDIFGSLADVWSKLSDFENISNPRQWLLNILSAVIEYTKENEINKYEKIVKDIKENIDKNFKTLTTVEQIIADLYISVSYAKTIFKKHTGQTIFDYLFEKRMKEAIILLNDPYIKVYEVAEVIGYKSKTYFAETFKNYMGMTPSEYRKKIL